MRAMTQWRAANPNENGFDMRGATARLIAAGEDGAAIEFTFKFSDGQTSKTLLVMSLGQLMTLKTQVAKDFNFGF